MGLRDGWREGGGEVTSYEQAYRDEPLDGVSFI